MVRLIYGIFNEYDLIKNMILVGIMIIIYCVLILLPLYLIIMIVINLEYIHSIYTRNNINVKHVRDK
jgi:hypothetical protein